MFFLPEVVWQRHIANAPPDLLADRNTQPLDALGGFNLVAITPIVFGKLHIIINDKFIHCGDQIKVALPGDVV